SDLSIGRSDIVAPAPQLPMEAQRSRTALTLGGNQAAVAPSPAVQPAGLSSSGQRLIALGIHPIAASGPVELPAGNRRGTFAASPQGKAGAAGTPDVAGASGNSSGGNGSGHSAVGTGSGAQTGIPPGLHVGAVPAAASSAIAGSGSGSGNSTNSESPFLLA